MTHLRHSLVPKLYTVLKEGYGLKHLKADAISGLTVAIVALPLAMAIAIASHATPVQGLITAMVAGFIISALGGSRHQIGGPTAAFIVVVAGVIDQFGYSGLLIATIMAGLMLIVAGVLRFGTYVKYIPHPVITGFTAGIAATIFIGQIKELLGFDFSGLENKNPSEVIERILAYIHTANTINPATVAVGLGSLGLMLLVRRYRPKWPVFLIGAGTGALVVWGSQYLGHPLPVTTIASKFGALSADIPMPSLPEGITLARLKELLPSALTIAFLAGIESLLSAVVADGMTGRRHRSNVELLAEGVANCASALVQGLPATGAIARTATNIRSGAHGPVSGMLHAVFLLVFLLVAAPLAGLFPLASLAAILVIVAWNISEVDHFKHMLKAPRGDRVILLATFLLTVFVDLTVAISVGVVLAAFIFMHRMSTMVEVAAHQPDIFRDTMDEDEANSQQMKALPSQATLPEGVQIYRIHGPVFFGAVSQINDLLDNLNGAPKKLILDMSQVPMMDASGVSSLETVFTRIAKVGGVVILAGLRRQPQRVLAKLGIADGTHGVRFVDTVDAALV